MNIEDIYERAAQATGLSVRSLEGSARKIFASMLLHALERPGEPILTGTKIVDGRLDCEVDIFLGPRGIRRFSRARRGHNTLGWLRNRRGQDAHGITAV